MKALFKMIYEENDQIQEEVEDLYKNLDRVSVSIPEALELLGFKEHFDKVMNDLDFSNPDFKSKHFDLSLQVHSMEFKLRDYLQGIDFFRHFQPFMEGVVSPALPLFNIENPDPLRMVETVGKLKENISEMFKLANDQAQMIKNGFDFMSSFPNQIKDTIDSFAAMREPMTPGEVRTEKNVVLW